MSKEIIVLVDGDNEVSLPNLFAKIAKELPRNNYNELKMEFVILEGNVPERDDYWEAWEDILSKFYWYRGETKYTLLHRGDLFGIPENLDAEHLFL